MAQMTLATNGFEAYRKTTRKAEFLSRMDTLVPWPEFCAVIEPYYPKAGNGRRPIGLERLMRMIEQAERVGRGHGEQASEPGPLGGRVGGRRVHVLPSGLKKFY